ncbi:MAG: mucoidy inhibitor MuiA family protein [Chitinophagaceae bacterium]|nr:MAG: mucoidy inhibitor MuiA family protein [Chitinophagaceae bacterium]
MMKKYILLVAAICMATTSLRSQDTTKVDATLSAATVYFGYGAELTHNVLAAVHKGTRQIVINQLSTAIDINSLQVSVPENVALLSQRFTTFTPAVKNVQHPMFKPMQDSIKLLQRAQARNRNLADIERETLEKTNKLIEMTMHENGNKTISSEDAIKLINANNLKIEKAKTNIFNLGEQYERLSEQIAALQQRMNELNTEPTQQQKTTGQLVLQVICSGNATLPITLSYFTSNAGFTASYDVRVQSKTNDMKLVYKAAVTQNTGIAWKQVKLTLSTSSPIRSTTAPGLTPWYLQLYTRPLYDNLKPTSAFQNNIQSLAKDDKALMEEVVTTGYGQARKKESAAYAMQTVDPSTLQRYTTLTQGQLNSNFEIDLPYNIESDGQVHSVTIKEEKLKATLKDFAIPKLDADAYLLAEIADWQQLDLLPGVANIIMDNTYLGKSVIDPNSTADTLNLSLGKDKRVAIKRIAVKEFTNSKISGNSNIKLFTYELTVKNNKVTDVYLLLKDQYPVSSTKEIEIKLEEDAGALVNAETGILSWKLQLKPGESKKIRFSYRVKYPKEMNIINL